MASGWWVAVAAVVFGAGLGACGTTMKGRVVTGSAGVVAVVPDDGARDHREGVGGVTVTIRSRGAGAIIGEAVSREDGRFSIKAPNPQARGRIDVVAEAEGYPRQQGTVVFPGQGSLLLVILPERDGGGGGPGAGDGAPALPGTPRSQSRRRWHVEFGAAPGR